MAEFNDRSVKRIADAVHYVEQRFYPTTRHPGNAQPGTAEWGVVRIYNATGHDLKKGEIVGIGEPRRSPTTSDDDFMMESYYTGDVYSEETHQGKFVILLDACPKDESRLALSQGTIQCFVSVLDTDAPNKTAGPVDGNWTNLVSGGDGAQIKWIQPGITGLCRALVDLSAPPTSVGTLVVRYEAIADKAWNTSIVQAVLLDADNNPILDDDEEEIVITLVDNAPSKHELIGRTDDTIGSRGWCFYKDTLGVVDRYYILTADSPARWIEGVISEEWPKDSDTVRMEISVESTFWWGASPNNGPPVTEESDFSDDESDIRTVVVIHDTLGIRDTDLPIHTKVRCVWDERRHYWLLEAAVIDDKRLYPFIVIEDVPPATNNIVGDTIDITPGCTEDAGIIMIWNDDKSGYTASRTGNDPEDPPLKIAVLNWTGTTMRGALNAHAGLCWGRKVRFNWQDPEGDPELLIMIDAIETISNDDLRTLRGYNISEEQAPYKQEGESDFELGSSDCETP